MRFNIPITQADFFVLIFLTILFGIGIRIVIGFFQTPKAKFQPSASDAASVFPSGSRIELVIDGMMCGMCETHIKDAIRKAFPDSKKIVANHTSGKARFILQDVTTRPVLEEKLHAVLDVQGYRLLSVSRH